MVAETLATLAVIVTPTGQSCGVDAIYNGAPLACRAQMVATREGVTFRPPGIGRTVGRTIATRWIVDGRDLVTGLRGRRNSYGRRGDLRVKESLFGRFTVHARSVGEPVTVVFEWEAQ